MVNTRLALLFPGTIKRAASAIIVARSTTNKGGKFKFVYTLQLPNGTLFDIVLDDGSLTVIGNFTSGANGDAPVVISVPVSKTTTALSSIDTPTAPVLTTFGASSNAAGTSTSLALSSTMQSESLTRTQSESLTQTQTNSETASATPTSTIPRVYAESGTHIGCAASGSRYILANASVPVSPTISGHSSILKMTNGTRGWASIVYDPTGQGSVTNRGIGTKSAGGIDTVMALFSFQNASSVTIGSVGVNVSGKGAILAVFDGAGALQLNRAYGGGSGNMEIAMGK
jgi:uncharacterized protein YceK